jgi:hypothetical protein
MGFFAPRLPRGLVDEIDRLADRPDRAADICRMIGEKAEEQGFRRPSYEQVRQHVHRARRRPRSVSTGEVLLDVALRVHHPDALIAHVSGTRTRFKPK